MASFSRIIVFFLLLAASTAAAQVECIDSLGVSLRAGGLNGIESVAVGYLDNDADLDVIATSFGDDRIVWFENDLGNPLAAGFIEHTLDTGPDSPIDVDAGDLDGDGDDDVLVASLGDDTIRWYENLGGPQPIFVEHVIDDDADGASAVVAADINGDGFVDVVAASGFDDTVAWHENDGKASPSFTKHVVSSVDDGVAGLAVAFVDDDLDLDIVSASPLSGELVWYEQTVADDEVIFIRRRFAAGQAGATAVYAIDVDGDMRTDIVAAAASDNRLAWYRNVDFVPDPTDGDADLDGIADGDDTCPLNPSADQTDSDGDGLGDPCDPAPADPLLPDGDGDGVPDGSDVCPTLTGQEDDDSDGLGNFCDPAPNDPTVPSDGDLDDDGVADGDDNCPDDANPGQTDSDGDGLGDPCDSAPADPLLPDGDGDGVPDGSDVCPDNTGQQDADGDGLGDVCDPAPDDPDVPSDGDLDDDGVADGDDNCPDDANPGQTDSDGDGLGDPCDSAPTDALLPDTDGDEVPDGSDVCPDIADASQDDADADGTGDACDPDSNDPSIPTDGDLDDDGVPDGDDNCPDDANAGQADMDGDGLGDACDSAAADPLLPDSDGDGVPDGSDTCPADSAHVDTDADGIGDLCDPDPDDPAVPSDGDIDDDGVPDGDDNCPLVANAAQTDQDADGLGDLCDSAALDPELPDTDGDGVPDGQDACPLDSAQADADDDGFGDLCDPDLDDPAIPGDGDLDDDGIPDGADNCAAIENVDQADQDADGLGDPCDPAPADPNARIGFTQYVISATQTGVKAVHAADVDGDGDVDVLAAAGFADSVTLFASDGGMLPSFTEQALLSGIDSPDAVLAADLNANGDLDIVTAAGLPGFPASRDRLDWLENDGGVPAAFTEREIARGAVAPESIQLVDLDADMDLDLVYASIEDDSLSWLRNETITPPDFTDRLIAAGVRGVALVRATDLDADGDPDLLVAAAGDDEVLWFENDGAATPAFTEHVVASGVLGASSVDAADIDGDGDLDVVATARDSNEVVWFAGDGATPPVFSAGVVVTDTAIDARSVRAVDLDGKNGIDLVVASSGDNTVSWFENDGTPMAPGFTARAVDVFASGVRTLDVGDFDGDDLPDILVGSPNTNSIALYLQIVDEEMPDATPTFAQQLVSQSAFVVRRVRALDVDDDGDVDIVGASSGDDSASWWENDGMDPPSFTEQPISTSAEEARDAVVADLDGDGKLDGIVASFFRISYHRGGTPERCDEFDATGDGRIDGVELIWLGAAFAQVCSDVAMPELDWWVDVDFDDNCIVDGDDLAILTSGGVWGRLTDECNYVCPAQ